MKHRNENTRNIKNLKTKERTQSEITNVIYDWLLGQEQ